MMRYKTLTRHILCEFQQKYYFSHKFKKFNIHTHTYVCV